MTIFMSPLAGAGRILDRPVIGAWRLRVDAARQKASDGWESAVYQASGTRSAQVTVAVAEPGGPGALGAATATTIDATWRTVRVGTRWRVG